MANLLKKAASGLMEKMLTPAQVVSVRAWQPSTLHEIVIHTPTVAMEKWESIKRFKCQVETLTYRDYTPAEWDVDTRQCTFYIETGHAGAGSRWARQLKAGDTILLGLAHAAPLPEKPGKILCLGDASALGHFLSLRQLTNREHYPMQGCVLLTDDYAFPASWQYPEFEFKVKSHGNGQAELEPWLQTQSLQVYTSIYIAGNIPLVQGLRKKLKTMPDVHAKIYAHGFWS